MLLKKEAQKIKRRAAYLRHKEKENTDCRMRYVRNKEYHLLRAKNYRTSEKGKRIRSEYAKKYAVLHKEERMKRHKELLPRYKDRINKSSRIRYKNDIQHRVKMALRNRIGRAIKLDSGRKLVKTMEMLGCDIAFFKEYIASKFTNGMDWGNYGEWHIDHIIPCSYFDLSKPENQLKCFNYSNMQPLWAKDNLIKNDNLPKPHQAQLL